MCFDLEMLEDNMHATDLFGCLSVISFVWVL
jgi:hypothetical protein